jgi:hypothetical protein
VGVGQAIAFAFLAPHSNTSFAHHVRAYLAHFFAVDGLRIGSVGSVWAVAEFATSGRGFVGHGLAFRRVISAVVSTDAVFENASSEVRAVLGAVFRDGTRTIVAPTVSVASSDHRVVCRLALFLGAVGRQTGLPGAFSEILAGQSIASGVDGRCQTQARDYQSPER